jgi:hypothetical protein
MMSGDVNIKIVLATENESKIIRARGGLLRLVYDIPVLPLPHPLTQLNHKPYMHQIAGVTSINKAFSPIVSNTCQQSLDRPKDSIEIYKNSLQHSLYL